MTYSVQSAINSFTKLLSSFDIATKEFMIAFYGYYLSSNDKIEAFRKAQLELKNKYPQPYYWGAFVILGI